MSLSKTLASASARHPWRTIAAWIAVTVLASVAIGGLLGGSLTTEGRPTNNPQSLRAEDVQERAFPADSGRGVTDIVAVRSQRHTVDSPQFSSLVRRLAANIRGTKGVANARTYLDDRGPRWSRTIVTRRSFRLQSRSRTTSRA